jgi:transposase
MKNFYLPQDEIQELHAAWLSAKQKKDVSAVYKIHALILYGSDMTRDEVSKVLFMSVDTISNYANQYMSGGIEKLCDTHYKGRPCKLTDVQLAELFQELDSNIHLTTSSVCNFVKLAYEISYTGSGMTDLLHTHGYTYKQPKLVPAYSDHELQEEFLEYFLTFMKAKKDNEAVFFVDAVHPVHNSKPAYGWIKKGEIQELKSNTGRSRLNLQGAMNAETYETTVIASEGSVNTDSTIQLFQYLEKLYPLAVTLYVVLDNAKYHFSELVQEYIQNSRIQLIFLPPYSPELNLIERLWRIFKKNVLYNKFYPSFDEFKKLRHEVAKGVVKYI